MLKKTVTYIDPFTKEEVTEDIYFHLTQAEMVKLELGVGSIDMGLGEVLTRLTQAKDGKEIHALFEKIVRAAYGVRTAEGKHLKTKELCDVFLASEAYSVFFMELIQDTDAQIAFVKGIVPGEITDEAIRSVMQGIEKEPKLKEVPKVDARHISKVEFLATPAEEMEELGRQLASGEIVIDE